MNNSKKLFSLVPILLCLLVFTTGCEQLNLNELLSEAEAADEMMLSPEFAAEECFAFDFPVSIAQADASQTFANADELDVFLMTLDREDRRNWDFVLPVTLTLAGETGTQTIQTEEDLRAIFAECRGHRKGDCNRDDDDDEDDDLEEIEEVDNT